jgi:CHAT domain-containing protein
VNKAKSWFKFSPQRQWKTLILVVLLFASAAVLPSIAIPTAQSQKNSMQLVQQGKALYQSGKFSEAAIMWQQAASSFSTQGDRTNQAMSLSNLSLTYQELGQWQQANQAIANSLDILQTQPPTSERSRIFAQSFDIQGRSQLAIGQAEAALESWQKATDFYTQISDSQGDVRRTGISQSQINYAQALQALGRYRRACKTLQTVLEIDATECNVSDKEIKDIQSQPESLQKVLGLRSFGDILRLVGQLDRSDQVLQTALQISERKYPQESSSIQLSIGNTKLALAQRAKETEAPKDRKDTTREKRFQPPLVWYQKSADQSNSQTTKVQAQLNQLRILIEETDQIAEAVPLLSQVRSQLANLPPSQTSIYAHINLAQSLICTKQTAEKSTSSPIIQSCGDSSIGKASELSSWTEIETLLNTALNQARILQDQRAEAYALGYLGGVRQQNKQYADAEDLTKRALSIATSLPAPDIAYRWHWQLGRIQRAQGKKTEDTLRYYTAAYDSLQSLRRDLVAIAPEVQFSFRDSVEPVYREYVDLLLQPEWRSKDNNLIKARDVIEALQLAELDDFFREACITAKPQKLDDIDSTAAVIYPIILSDRLDVILKLPGQEQLQYHSNAVSSKVVKEELEQLRNDVVQIDRNGDVKAQSQKVYEWLIAPLQDKLAASKVKTLAFVLDGELRNIPMSVLYDGNQYLVEKYAIALTPGLQLLSPKPLASIELNALTAGISEGMQIGPLNFNPLGNVEKEIKDIQAIAPGQELLNQEFTQANLRSQLKERNFPIVHLATHGQFSSNSDQTYILAWQQLIKIKDLNSLLTNREIGKAPKIIELLVLSACETAQSDRRAILGLAGFAVRAGARSTLATLWQTYDPYNAELMSKFYRELSKPNTTRAEALRQVQLESIADKKQVYYWSAFVLIGSWL